MHFDVTPAVVADLPELADVAARTFPLACPPSVSVDNIAAFIDENLSEDRFRRYLADPDRAVLVVREEARMVGYAMLVRADDGIELSKIYVLPGSHGAGASAALMTAALSTAKELGAESVWLGVNQQNERAQRFYAKQGFTVTGTRTFRLGESVENDYVMVRPV
ncbi:GNAT family N-acetyltransferase [Mycolicibacterium tusciae]|uniref:GNAT family N-acetyltransferase n=1 Tax=Mycolicibacterium tusciae TaxID=75922 RepID=A0A1X0K0Z9_9MYCO|nr:GNAT family N-acetyltransferase [Mycolicibacterium tusciae]